MKIMEIKRLNQGICKCPKKEKTNTENTKMTMTVLSKICDADFCIHDLQDCNNLLKLVLPYSVS